MKRVQRVILFFVCFLVSETGFCQPGKDKVVTLHGKKYYQHIVVKGETVYGVSRDFNLTVGNIVLENPRSIDGIAAGDTLNIPVSVPGPKPNDNTLAQKDTAQSANGAYIYHKVEAKETMYSLCRQYGVSTSVVDSLNPDIKEKGLRVGMILKIPNRNFTSSKAQQGKQDTIKEKQAFKSLVQQATNNNQPVANITPGKLLNRYNVTLMLPFMPQEVDSIKMTRLLEGTQQFPLQAKISTDFYEGARIALDSLSMLGLNMNLYVYNIPSDSADYKIDSILRLPVLASMNFIIGPPYPSHFKRVAKYALAHQIPIVSPLSTESSVLRDNPYTSKAVPSPSTQIEQMADYIATTYRNSNIIIVHNTDALNDNYYDIFKKRITATLSIAEPKTDSVTPVDYSKDLNDLGKKIWEKKNNVIVVPYEGASFVTKLVNQLATSDYADDDSIVVYGMQNWTTMDVLDQNNLDTLHFHCPSNEYMDYSDHSTSRFVQKFRTSYYTDPSPFACQGFDVTYYYLGLLKKYGTGMQDHLMDEKYKGIHTSFNFYKPDPLGGYENKGIYMLEYRYYKMVKDSL